MALASPALETALALLDSPVRLALCRAQPLPDDILGLIRIAAGDAESRQQASVASHRPEAMVAEAAVFYIQHVLFDSGSDSYRTLGVGADWSSERIKEHYRWLVRWLHPDRNTDDWDAVYADRVTRAWNDLRTPERRREYDQARALAPVRREEAPIAPAGSAAPIGYRRMALDDGYVEPSRLSSRARQRLPLLIFGGLFVVAVLGLTLIYLGQQPAAGEFAEAAVPEAAPAPVAQTEPEPARPAPAMAAPAPPAVRAPAAVPSVRQPKPVAMVATVASARTVAAPARPAVRPALVMPKDVPRAHATPAVATASESALAPVAADRTTRSVSRPARAVATPPANAPVATPAPIVAAARVAPPPAVAPAAAPAAELPSLPPDMDLATVNDLLRRFRGAYASGDLGRMRPLMAQHGGTLARDQVLARYQRLFADSSSRRLEIRNPSWRGSDAHAVILAAADSWWMPTGRDDTEHAEGTLRLDLVWEDGQWRIQDLHHDERGR